jgi:hypothetical protein
MVTIAGIWVPVSNRLEHPRIVRLDPMTLTVVDAIAIQRASFSATAAFGSVWLPEGGDGTGTTMERFDMNDLVP